MSHFKLFTKKLINNGVFFYIGCVISSVVLLILSLRLWRYNLNIPINYWGDTLQVLLPIKSFLLNGSPYTVPQLSAPYTFDLIAFPSFSQFDWWVISAGIAWFSGSLGLTLNLLWLLSVVLTSLTAYFSLNFLGGNRWLSLIGALIYAFLPFAFFRNTAHVILIYYMVPLLCVLIINIAQGLYENKKNAIYLYVGYTACFIQGLSYIYNSFFASALLVFAAILGYIKTKKWFPVWQGIIAVSIISFATLISLSPTLISWRNAGVPPNMDYKLAMEAEIHGLKIRKLLVPHTENKIFPLGRWAQKDSVNFPNDSENVTSRLGVYTSLGFLLLLAFSLSILSTNDEKIKTLSRLSLFTLLMATVGGFGAIFNVLVARDIRSYSRISVFIAFFAIAGITLFLSEKLEKIHFLQKRRALYFAVFMVFLISMYDQTLEAFYIPARYAHDTQAVHQEQEIVAKMEKFFPAHTSVFQLPLASYPPDGGRFKMCTYDHARPFLWSNHLKWSWPSFSYSHAVWEKKISTLSDKSLLEALVFSGFGAIWVDRYGYKDNGNKLIKELTNAGAREKPEISNTRYVVLDLQPFAETFKEQLGENSFKARKNQILYDVDVLWGHNFYKQETSPDGIEYRWSRKKSHGYIVNPSASTVSVKISFVVQSLTDGTITIKLKDKKYELPASSLKPSSFNLEVVLGPRERKKLSFAANMPKKQISGDSRERYFTIQNFKIEQNLGHGDTQHNNK